MVSVNSTALLRGILARPHEQAGAGEEGPSRLEHLEAGRPEVPAELVLAPVVRADLPACRLEHAVRQQPQQQTAQSGRGALLRAPLAERHTHSDAPGLVQRT